MKYIRKILCSMISIFVVFAWINTYAADEVFEGQNTINPIIRILNENKLALHANVAESGYCGGEGDGTNLTWTLYEDGLLEISGTGKMMESNKSISTECAKDYPWYAYIDRVNTISILHGVTYIGRGAFAHNQYVQTLNVEAELEGMGWSAFYGCTRMTNLYLSDGVKLIGDSAFQNCTRLTNIKIPNSVTSIGSRAFYGCPFKSITIPNSVKSIGTYTFSSCKNLSDIYISNTKNSISGSPWGATNATVHWLDMNLVTIEDLSASYTYTGSMLIPTVTVTDGTDTLVKDTDYIVDYVNNINVGTATVTITGIGNYVGTKTATFNIMPKTSDSLKISDIPNQTYTGFQIKPPIIVIDTERS